MFVLETQENFFLFKRLEKKNLLKQLTNLKKNI
jgi:hypothetical protein